MQSETDIGRLLLQARMMLAVAESCTGGLLGHRVTSVSGSSRYFLGGIIAYSNAVKTALLGVDAGLLEREGAVSEAVALQMAKGVRRAFGAGIGVGITGIAGPEGGSENKPVGLVFIALDASKGAVSQRFDFAGDRDEVKKAATDAALEMIRSWILKTLRRID